MKRTSPKKLSKKLIRLATALTLGLGAFLASINATAKELLPQKVATGFTLGHGVNISHWLSQRGDHQPAKADFFTREDILFLKEQGFDHVRLPIEESIMWQEDGTRNPHAFQMLDTAIEWANEADLTVIVDLHIVNSHHFNASNDGGKNTLFSDPASQDHLVSLWDDLSSFLEKWNNDFLAYEILNEAVADNHEDWNKLLAKCIPAIRKLEPERPLIIGSNRWQQAETMPFLKIPFNDPNIILSYHFYAPFPFTHYQASWVGGYGDYDGPINYPGLITDQETLTSLPEGPAKSMLADNLGPHTKETLREEMQPAINFARQHNMPLYCGEWGSLKTVDREDMLQWYRDMSEILREEGVQSAIWDYKGGFNIVNGKTGKPDHELIDTILNR